MAGDAATSAAARVKPSQEALEQMDRPADDNTWHDAPDFSKDNMRKQMQNVYKGKPTDDVKAAITAGQVEGQAVGTGPPAVTDLANPQTTSTTTGTQPIDAHAGLTAATSTLQQRVSENLDDETKAKIKARNEEYRRRTREYFNKKMPQERKEQTIFRLKVCNIVWSYCKLRTWRKK
jgi:hypothetical protein